VALGISTDCVACHSNAQKTWSPSSFNHDSFYKLEGAHTAITDCAKCHKGGDIKLTPTTCNGCHNADFNKTSNPNHVAAGFSTDCVTCHTVTKAWAGATFDHSFYPLTGAHANVATNCVKCHTSNNYKTTPKDCNSCHNANFKTTTNPNHMALGISTDCVACHSNAQKTWSPSSFNHDSFYKLEGAHTAITDCAKCHKGGDIKLTPTTCNGCHNADFNKTSNPNHVAAGFSTDCVTCHTVTKAWAGATFDHSFYPLTGAHANVATNCVKCHTSNNYKTTPKDCNSCHNANFKATTNPNHVALGISTDCVACHSNAQKTWSPSSFNHDSFYKLEGAHTAITNCAACHKGGDIKLTPTTCNGCHNADFNKTSNPNHVAAGFSTDCVTCHTVTKAWAGATFDHSFYPLTGAHANVATNCVKCHTSNNYKTTPKDCNSCHNANFKATTNPNHVALGISTDCVTCHSTTGWKPSSFNHDNTSFQLNGGHAIIANNCASCHKTGNLSTAPTDCNSCHNAKYKATTNPNHVSGGFGTDCASCHTTAPGWAPSTFDHSKFYVLTGAHISIKNNCTQCHIGGLFTKFPHDCNNCHNTKYKATTNPNHLALGISTDCVSCHSTNPGWASTFDHNSTSFPLTGGHSSIKANCASCHKTGNLSTAPTDCNSCHNAKFKATTNPNHVALGISTNCVACHTTTPGWTPSTFDHNSTSFPLTGGHATIKSNCASCHKTGNISTAPTDCNSCHNATFKATTNPNHVAGGFGTDCATCHSTNPGWRPATFDHDKFYVLTGAHISIKNNCTQCHIGGNFNKFPHDCNNCHNAKFKATINPNHVTLGISTDCAACHTTNPGWSPTTFNHNATSFPLTGGHIAIATNCASCHKTGNISTAPTDCNSCHNTKFKATVNPNHVALGISTNCVNCHTTNPGWAPSTFNHNATSFPLSGAHVGIATNCASCHKTGNISTAPTNCNSCHNGAYNSSTNPNHKVLGISTECVACHTTNPTWKPSTFNHNAIYPLVGAHAAIANNCTLCHKGGNISNAPTTCIGCHQTNYNTATPNHLTSHFPTSCTDCHSQTAWKPANWNHDATYFPIYSGKHRQGQAWNNCSECHTTASNYGLFSCVDCHHKKPEMDLKHKQVKGYIGNNIDCLQCHPKGLVR
jgi:hypothetical protein